VRLIPGVAFGTGGPGLVSRRQARPGASTAACLRTRRPPHTPHAATSPGNPHAPRRRAPDHQAVPAAARVAAAGARWGASDGLRRRLGRAGHRCMCRAVQARCSTQRCCGRPSRMRTRRDVLCVAPSHQPHARARVCVRVCVCVCVCVRACVHAMQPRCCWARQQQLAQTQTRWRCGQLPRMQRSTACRSACSCCSAARACQTQTPCCRCVLWRVCTRAREAVPWRWGCTHARRTACALVLRLAAHTIVHMAARAGAGRWRWRWRGAV
jgi:hypothetical protein